MTASWVTPKTDFNPGDVLTAAEVNNIGTDLGLVGLIKIWDSVDAGVTLPAASVTTPTLSQTFKHLVVEISARSSGASSFCVMRANADASADYGYVYGGATTTGTVASGTDGTASPRTGMCNPSTAAANTVAVTRIVIHDYAQAVAAKSANWTTTQRSAADLIALVGGWTWTGTAAIATLTFLPDAGNFVADSRITIYGES